MAKSLRWVPFLLLLLGVLLVLGLGWIGSDKPLELRATSKASKLSKAKFIEQAKKIAFEVEMAISKSKTARYLDRSLTGNPIDDCWRRDPKWHLNRTRLADCGIGFGRDAIGGRDGEIYVVTDPGHDDPVNPRQGTLRHAVIQERPLWIIFKRNMVIKLKQELIMTSYKTIDGRGAKVHIAYGACLTLQYISHVIIHNVHIHDCMRTGHARVRNSSTHCGWRGMADGDGISIFSSSNVWVDHCSLSKCSDGLVDAIRGSTNITITNNHFSHHNKVMLLGHNDAYKQDDHMLATIALNHFGEGVTQRMPRCRRGFFHVINNDYTHWRMYAIGGSANPFIISQANRYVAPNNRYAKEVTKRANTSKNEWKKWRWISENDIFLNGAFFVSSHQKSPVTNKTTSWDPKTTADAGVLPCRIGSRC
ncbi:putative pectate lyase 8 isoform X2 [Canna indica]|uniref:Pectate lyase n=1 Tax=Canna indica TaxID=4628 RepID=A0AAQ3QM34_9LILI|nr:putative pectate lyase 8 isoform X2 [Canna indica]